MDFYTFCLIIALCVLYLLLEAGLTCIYIICYDELREPSKLRNPIIILMVVLSIGMGIVVISRNLSFLYR